MYGVYEKNVAYGCHDAYAVCGARGIYPPYVPNILQVFL